MYLKCVMKVASTFKIYVACTVPLVTQLNAVYIQLSNHKEYTETIILTENIAAHNIHHSAH